MEPVGDLSIFIVLWMSILLPLKACLPGWPCRSGARPPSDTSVIIILSVYIGRELNPWKLQSSRKQTNALTLWSNKNKQKKGPKIYKSNLWVHSIALWCAGVFCFFFAVIFNCEFPIPDLQILKLEEEQLIPSARGVYACSPSIFSPPWSPRDIYDSYITLCCSLSTAFQIHELKQSSVTFIISHKWIYFTFHSVFMLL